MAKRTKKANTPKKPDTGSPTALHNAAVQEGAEVVRNGLSEALLGFNPGGIGVQLSQVDTLFKNNRWYLVSNMRQLLSQIYVEHGLVQTVVDVPVDDGLRGGIDIKTKQLSPEQVEELSANMEREEDLTTIGQAIKWNRLFGGAGILILTEQDPSLPLDVAAINKDSKLAFRAVDMWELFFNKQNVEGDNSGSMDFSPEFEHYNYYGKKVHRSRVMMMKGLTPPSFIRPRLRGWGFSIVESIVRSINQYLKANDLGFEVLDEFKVDVFKIKNLVSTLLAPDGTARIQQRVQLANQTKNYQHALVMDSEDDYDHKQLTWSGLADAMAGIRMQIASDLRMPLTKVFGISAAGFNSGEDDIENYNAMVESQVRSKCKYDIVRIVELRCQKLFGFVPDDLKIEFHPLRVLSAEQEENVKTQKFNRVVAAYQAGLINSLEFKNLCNQANLLPSKLDTTLDEIEASTIMDVEGGNEEDEQDGTAEPKQAGENGLKKADEVKTKTDDRQKTSTLKPPHAPKAKNDANAVSEFHVNPLPVTNSLDYDKKAFEVDGGDRQYDAHWERDIQRSWKLGKLDKTKWLKAEAASLKAFGKVKWQFALWKYKRDGGKL